MKIKPRSLVANHKAKYTQLIPQVEPLSLFKELLFLLSLFNDKKSGIEMVRLVFGKVGYTFCNISKSLSLLYCIVWLNFRPIINHLEIKF